MNICHMYKLMIKTHLYFACSSLYIFGGSDLLLLWVEIWLVLDTLMFDRSQVTEFLLQWKHLFQKAYARYPMYIYTSRQVQ